MRGADKMLLLLLAWSNPVGALGESGGALSNAHKSHTHTVPPTAKPFPQDLRPAHPAKDKLVHGQQTRAATPAIPLAAVPPSTEAKPGHAKERLHAVLPTEVRPPHKEHKQGHAQPQPSGTSLPPPPPPPPSSSGGGGGLPVVSLLVLVAIGAFAYSKDLGAYVGDLSAWGQQIGAFAVLVTVQACALLLFKLCQTSGTYSFSPASCVALTEACKLGLAASLHYRHVLATGSPLFEQLSPRMVAHYFGLAMCYTVNNQLTFYCFQAVDPGTFGLGKSLAPYLVALLLRFTGQRLNELQWVCIMLQCILIAITQYNSCQSATVLPFKAYALLATSTCITAVSSVWNQKVIKGFAVPVNLQNALLYIFGFVIAVISYVAFPDRTHPERGFFEGYGALAIILVLFQAFHGLAVTLVYKYADAIVKNFANSAVMAILVMASAYLFGATTTVHSWLGVAGVLVTTYAYMNVALKM